MRLSVFEPQMRDDPAYFVEKERRLALKALKLVEAVMRDPFGGERKPEALRELGSDVWARRIDKEHRLVYQVDDTAVRFLQARHHDGK